MPNILEVQEFFVEGRDPGKAHVLLHIAEPSAPHEKERGYFFALAEVVNGYPEQMQILQELIDRIEIGFYAREERGKDILERVLHAVNLDGRRVLEYEDSEIHCLIGSMSNGNIAIAYHNSPIALLFYAGKDRLETTPIIEQQTSSLTEEQLFSEIVEGAINPGEYVYCATTHVADYFNNDRISKLLGSRNIRQSATQIEKVLSDVDSDYSFGGILFHMTDKNDTPKTGVLPTNLGAGSEESLNKLFASAESTAKILSPPLFGPVSKKLKRFLKESKIEHPEINLNPTEPDFRRKNRAETNHRHMPARNRETFFGKFLISFGRGIILIVQGIGLTLYRLFIGINSLIRTLFVLITNRHGARSQTVELWRLGYADKKQYLAHLPTVSKILLISTLTLGLIFIGSLSYLKIKENREAKNAQYNNIVQAIIDKKDAAEANLIYEEKTKALELLQEAAKLIEQLPRDNENQIAKADELKATLAPTLEKIRDIKTIDPELVADLKATNQNAMAERIVKINDQLVAFGENDNQLYAVNLISKQVSVKSHDVVKNLAEAVVPAEEDKIIFLTKDKGLGEYDPKIGAVVAKSIAFPVDNVVITGVGIYNRKLYIIDSVNKQIYKHNQTQTGYDKGSVWTKNNFEELTLGRSITIDGDVYVLTATGVKKFYTGEEQVFVIAGLDPGLTAPSFITTNSNLKDLYILEPMTKRVIIINKDGVFKQQYTATVWQNPTSMVVEDDGKTVYILDNNKIYKFEIK